MQKGGEAAASPARFFGAEAREARKRAGMSQPELAALAGYDPSYVSKVENGAITPDQKFIDACDAAFPEMHGWFARFWLESQKWDGPIPAWFREWLDAEAAATSLWIWSPILIPGLFQTGDYARALLLAEQTDTSEERIDALVAARLERSAIFEKSAPPEVVAVIDEWVLHRTIGSPQVMYEQLIHLAEMSTRPSTSVQVVPVGNAANAGLGGAFDIAVTDGSPGTLRLEGLEDQTTDRRSLVRKAGIIFNRVRGDALPRNASRDLIRKVGEERWRP